MSNSRSQTKIRKTQQVNLLAEQRYFRQKNLLFENIEEFQECFDSFAGGFSGGDTGGGGGISS